ncbi:MAG TPA: hypothetical protein VNY82_04465 [Steroidobacteraceae bacterium]|jgi:hypothetical protein|nr:hypothetical protein [Steroidobacteraceae bacterium]
MKLLSRRALDKLGTLQASVQELGAHRNTALRMFIASRNTTTAMAQREFWLEFAWVDQEYRIAVRRLAQFCTEHQDNSGDRWRVQPA